MLYTSPWTGFTLSTLVVIGIDCTGSCKSNYHTITTTTPPQLFSYFSLWCLDKKLLQLQKSLPLFFCFHGNGGHECEISNILTHHILVALVVILVMFYENGFKWLRRKHSVCISNLIYYHGNGGYFFSFYISNMYARIYAMSANLL